jgi:hypothetical protein
MPRHAVAKPHGSKEMQTQSRVTVLANFREGWVSAWVKKKETHRRRCTKVARAALGRNKKKKNFCNLRSG